MLKRIYLLIFVVASLIISCTPSTQNGTTDKTNASGESDTNALSGKKFGAAITPDGAITYEALLAKMSDSDSVSAKVIADVEGVCQTKGCWMNIASKREGIETMFVKFKDYGFFMPLDIASRRVIMDGYAYREITSVEELRHYAEDEGKSKEEVAAITEPEEELKFLASGVILLDE